MTREQTIEAILNACREPMPRIAEATVLVEPKTGRTFSVVGVPVGVDRAKLEARHGYVLRAADGTAYGKRHATREEALAACQASRAKDEAHLRGKFEAMPDAVLADQAANWLV